MRDVENKSGLLHSLAVSKSRTPDLRQVPSGKAPASSIVLQAIYTGV